jgi:hypothetical protein
MNQSLLLPLLVSISSTFTCAFFVYTFGAKKLQSGVLALRLFGAKILYKKLALKTLMKLTGYYPG